MSGHSAISDSMNSTTLDNSMNVSGIDSAADVIPFPTQLQTALSAFEQQTSQQRSFTPLYDHPELERMTSCECIPEYPPHALYSFEDAHVGQFDQVQAQFASGWRAQAVKSSTVGTPRILTNLSETGQDSGSFPFSSPFLTKSNAQSPAQCQVDAAQRTNVTVESIAKPAANMPQRQAATTVGIGSAAPGTSMGSWLSADKNSTKNTTILSQYDQIELSEAKTTSETSSDNSPRADDVDQRIQRKQQIITKLIPGQLGATVTAPQRDEGRRWPFPELLAHIPGEMPKKLRHSELAPAQDKRLETLVQEARAGTGYETRFMSDALLFARASYE